MHIRFIDTSAISVKGLMMPWRTSDQVWPHHAAACPPSASALCPSCHLLSCFSSCCCASLPRCPSWKPNQQQPAPLPPAPAALAAQTSAPAQLADAVCDMRHHQHACYKLMLARVRARCRCASANSSRTSDSRGMRWPAYSPLANQLPASSCLSSSAVCEQTLPA